MFKRPRLRPARPLVNVSLAASLIFISACFGEQASNETETPVIAAPNDAVRTEGPAKLQAVWSTRSLSAPITDVALSGGVNPVLAAVLEGKQLQLFDLDGERLSDPTTLGVTALADGTSVTLNDINLTVFPGIGDDGALNLYLYNIALGAPVALDMLPQADAAGLCAGPSTADGALIKIAYWTEAVPDTLIIGDVFEADGAFRWDVTDTREIGERLGGCNIASGEAHMTADTGAPAGLIAIKKGAQEKLLRLNETGELVDIAENSAATAMPIRNGISVLAPSPIVALSALSDAQFGGYPNGVIVLGGLVDGTPKLVFVEPIGLFDAAPE